jgi:hypothetical protein
MLVTGKLTLIAIQRLLGQPSRSDKGFFMR